MVFLQLHNVMRWYFYCFTRCTVQQFPLRIQLLLWQKKTNLAPACLSLILNYEITSAKLTSSFLAFNNEQTGRQTFLGGEWNMRLSLSDRHNQQCLQHSVWCTMTMLAAQCSTMSDAHCWQHDSCICQHFDAHCDEQNILLKCYAAMLNPKYYEIYPLKKYLWTKLNS